jgi:hypothetical protein
MRYAWDLQHQYLEQSGLDRGVKSLYTRWLLHKMRAWDQASAARPDAILANSRYIARRIAKTWRREAEVLHPPVDVEAFPLATAPRGHFLVAGRQVPYKRIELVAEAFRALPDLTLIIAGDGPSAPLVRAAAAGASNIEIRGRVPQAELLALLQGARAFVFPAEEDFGIGMVEAQACGTPLIAFARGGAADIVTPETGMVFAEQSAASIAASVRGFLAREGEVHAAACHANAMRFSIARFREGLRDAVARRRFVIQMDLHLRNQHLLLHLQVGDAGDARQLLAQAVGLRAQGGEVVAVDLQGDLRAHPGEQVVQAVRDGLADANRRRQAGEVVRRSVPPQGIGTRAAAQHIEPGPRRHIDPVGRGESGLSDPVVSGTAVNHDLAARDPAEVGAE